MKILLISSIYPIPNIPVLGGTSVCHYFAKEWIKQGHEVMVINTYTVYHPLLHMLSKKLEKVLVSRYAASINSTRFKSIYNYEIDGVKVALIPTYKILPRLSFPNSSIQRTANKILSVTKDVNFIPDIVTTHFLHPNLELIPILKKFWDVKMGLTLHGKITRKQEQKISKRFPEIDFWGFRSYAIMKSFMKYYSESSNNNFLCFSGIPISYINYESFKKHQTIGVDNYLYVGNLSKRKYPVKVLEALAATKNNFKLDYVGVGDEQRRIESLVSTLHLTQNVTLHGRVNRDTVAEMMEKSECFIMISKAETFGLVYLEAMAKGCIVVASKDEGMDGIIIDGLNGFLCEAGNSKELELIIKTINNLTSTEKIRISKNAIETAKKMTDHLMSSKYLEFLSLQK